MAAYSLGTCSLCASAITEAEFRSKLACSAPICPGEYAHDDCLGESCISTIGANGV
jgi:hypothetical protein